MKDHPQPHRPGTLVEIVRHLSSGDGLFMTFWVGFFTTLCVAAVTGFGLLGSNRWASAYEVQALNESLATSPEYREWMTSERTRAQQSIGELANLIANGKLDAYERQEIADLAKLQLTSLPGQNR